MKTPGKSPSTDSWKARWLISTTLLAILCASCSSLGSLEAPDVTLTGVQLIEVTVFETTIEAKLRIGNPNVEPLTFEGASFKLELEDRKVGRGMTPERFAVPPLSSEVIPVTFHISNATAMLRLKQILDQQTVSYGVSATLYLDRPGGTKKVKAQRQGQIDFKAMGLSSPTEG